MNFPLHFHIALCLLNTESIQQTDAVPADRLSSRNADETFSFHVAWFHIICTYTCIHCFLFKNRSLSYSFSNSIYNACSLLWPCCIPDLQKTQLRSMLSLFQLKTAVLHFNQFITESIWYQSSFAVAFDRLESWMPAVSTLIGAAVKFKMLFS